MAAALRQVGFIARRSLNKVLRQPFLIVPSLTFPLFLMAVNSGGLNAVTKLPGFPTDSYVDFALALTFLQGALFSAINAGTELATDIQHGFLNRLQLTPLRRVGGADRADGRRAGDRRDRRASPTSSSASPAARISRPASAACSCCSRWRCSSRSRWARSARRWPRRSGSAEAVQGLFPLLFVLLFLSSAITAARASSRSTGFARSRRRTR